MDEESIGVQEKVYSSVQVHQRLLYSEYLERDVIVDLYLPTSLDKEKVSLLLINDGQDLRKIDFAAIFDSFLAKANAGALACVGIHCGADRINEYGTAYRADYMGRGAKAGAYNKFIFDELLAYILAEFSLTIKEKSFAGFSLGGLSALDIVWNHPTEFTNAGVFSGSLWWRRRAYEDEGYDYDKDRIMHLQVQKGKHFPSLKFFFECGCLDESADRNNNGIIDSIDDTIDLIEDMKAIGYGNEQIHYLELKDGEHNVETWARAFPEFLEWGWGRDKATSK